MTDATIRVFSQVGAGSCGMRPVVLPRAHSFLCAPAGLAGCVPLCEKAYSLSEGWAYARAYAYCGFLRRGPARARDGMGVP